MVDLLQSKLLVSIVEEVAPALKKDTAGKGVHTLCQLHCMICNLSQLL